MAGCWIGGRQVILLSLVSKYNNEISMKIYFACSITGGRKDVPYYQAIVRFLLARGCLVPTASLADDGVVALEESASPAEVYARDVLWITESDGLIAEVSTPSHGVGYELGYALSIGKPVLCLFQENHRISKMITGNPDRNLLVLRYSSLDDLQKRIDEFLVTLSRRKVC